MNGSTFAETGPAAVAAGRALVGTMLERLLARLEPGGPEGPGTP
jgi:hypothetical protein